MSYGRSKILSSGFRVFMHAACLAMAFGVASAQAADQTPPCLSGLSCTMSGRDINQIKSYVDGVVGNALNNEPVVSGQQPVLSAIVGVSWHGRRTYFGYGKNTVAYEPDTIVEIGSITKVFTTALLAEAAQEKGVSLDERLADYQAALGLSSLTVCGGNATLRELANFSSGMPRLPDNLPANDSIANYSASQFKAWVSGWTPTGASSTSCSLPDSYVYSNASVGLLGYIVAYQLGAPYEQLIADRITTPLRMSSTFLPNTDGSVPPALASRIAVGRSKNYQPVSPWPFYAWFAAGALRSDAEDMLSFGEAALGNPSRYDLVTSSENQNRISSLQSALKTGQTTTYPVLNPDGSLAFNQGLSWVQEPGDPAQHLATVYLKDGGTNGFNTVIVINPAQDLAVFIAIGKTKSGIDALGINLARLIR